MRTILAVVLILAIMPVCSVEAADIFATAMRNNFKVGKVIIDAILNGEL